ETFIDSNKNQVWDEGEPYEDKNKNGRFDAYWMAGFGSGRLAYGVHDMVWARALAMRQNQTTVVLVSVDALGLFAEETAEVQKLLDPRLDIDLLMIHATHVHQNADLVGDGPEHDMKRYVSDSRDPVVIDNTLHTMQFLDISNTPPKPIATLVNWA